MQDEVLQEMVNRECLEETGFTAEEIEMILNADDPDAVINDLLERR